MCQTNASAMQVNTPGLELGLSSPPEVLRRKNKKRRVCKKDIQWPGETNRQMGPKATGEITIGKEVKMRHWQQLEQSHNKAEKYSLRFAIKGKLLTVENTDAEEQGCKCWWVEDYTAREQVELIEQTSCFQERSYAGKRDLGRVIEGFQFCLFSYVSKLIFLCAEKKWKRKILKT